MTRAPKTRSSLIRRFTFKRGSAIFVWATLVAGLMLPSQSAEAAIEGLKAPIFSSPAIFFQTSFRRSEVSRTPDSAGPQAQPLVLESAALRPSQVDPVLRDRVLKNVADSKAAQQASKFESLPHFEKIERARQAQISTNYGGQDQFAIVTLKKGDLVYGGFPGQSAWYTDVATVKASGLNGKMLFESLQVQKNSARGYRPTIRVYRVMRDIEVPAGRTFANPKYGKGGGTQFYIEDFTGLKPVRDFQLK